MSDIQELRLFLHSLVSSDKAAPRRLPPVLLRLVRGFRLTNSEADDATQDLLLDLAVRSNREQAGGVLELLKLEDDKLLAALRRRARQVLCEKSPRGKLRKSVTAMVRVALDADHLPG